MATRRCKHAAFGIFLFAGLGALAGCNTGSLPYSPDPGTEPPDGETSIGPTCAPPPACNSAIQVAADSPALLITDPQVLARVPLDRVLDQIHELHGSSRTPVEAMQRLFDTMNDTAGGRFADVFHCDDLASPAFVFKGDDTFICPRAEGALASSEAFFEAGHPDSFFPVAIVNRFDLTPVDGTRCGQYRIIYAKQSGLTDPSNRVFLIFEAALLSPMDGCVEACRPVAEALVGLEGLSSAEMADRIDEIFFTGLPGIGPVVHPLHYGLMSDDAGYGGLEGGQVRISMHMEDPWDMREVRLPFAAEGDDLTFVPATVKNSPAPSAFDPTSDTWAAIVTKEQFLPTSLVTLASPEVTSIQMFTPIEANGVESVVAGEKKADYYAAATAGGDPTMVEYIDALIAQQDVGADCPPDDPLDAEAVLRRATALSCAGCHAPSGLLGPTRSVGCGVTWPDSIGQAHVTEKGEISPALKDVFLPHRAKVLEAFLQACDPAAMYGGLQSIIPGAVPANKVLSPGRTLGGGRTH